MKLKNILLLIALVIMYSCKNGLNGRIEVRGREKVYLVNTSGTKPFKFTVKITTTINDSLKDYSTTFVNLAPGDEKLIGVKSEILKQAIPKPAFDPNKPYTDISDTVKTTVDEYCATLISKMNYSYEVTGQLEVKK